MESAQGLPAAYPANAFAERTDPSVSHPPGPTVPNERDALERRIGELQVALDLKTALIHEMEHRARNTFQVITSLVLLKARRTPNGEARTALEVIADRIGALSTAHRMLASEGDSPTFDSRDFVTELLSDVNAALPDDRIQVVGEIEALALPAIMAAPLALMVHELAANAARHAYPGERRGSVRVDARRTDRGLALTVCDEGVGLGPERASRHGFGRSLVETVVRQVRGSVVWAPGEPGTRVVIEIPLG